MEPNENIPNELNSLAIRAKAGDSKALEDLLRQYDGGIRAIIWGLQPGNLFDDLKYIAWNLIWTAVLPGFDPGKGSFSTWANTILRGRLQDELNKLRHGQATLSSETHGKLKAAYARLTEQGERVTPKRLHEETAQEGETTGCHLDSCYKFLYTKRQEVDFPEGMDNVSGKKDAPPARADRIPASEPDLATVEADHRAAALTVVRFIWDEWLSERQRSILDNDDMGEKAEPNDQLATTFGCSVDTVRQDRVMAKAWLALLSELLCHKSGLSAEEAYKEIAEWIDSFPDRRRDEVRAAEDEDPLAPVFRTFRDRRKLKLEDISKARRQFGEYERKWSR